MGNSESVPLVSVGLPSRETARGFCSARKSLTCSSWEWKRTPLWAGVAGALLEFKLTGSVITVKEPRVGVRFTLSDDLRGSPDFFLGNSGIGSLRATAAAARAWTCDSDKLRVNMTAGLCRGAEGESSLLSALAGAGVECSGGRMAGKRWPRIRHGGIDRLIGSDGVEGPNGNEIVEFCSAVVSLVGVGGRT